MAVVALVAFLAKVPVDLYTSAQQGDGLGALNKDLQGTVKAGDLANTLDAEALAKELELPGSSDVKKLAKQLDAAKSEAQMLAEELGLPNAEAIKEMSEADLKKLTPQQLEKLSRFNQTAKVLAAAGKALKGASLAKNISEGQTDKAVVDAAGLIDSKLGDVADGANKVRKGVGEIIDAGKEQDNAIRQKEAHQEANKKRAEDMLLIELAYQERADEATRICKPPTQLTNQPPVQLGPKP